jgi:transposase
LRPTAEGDSVGVAVAEDRALLGSNPSAAAEPTGTGGLLRDAACFIDQGAAGGQPSQCERLRSVILGLWQQGLSAQRIYQDLVAEHGFGGSYYSVRRFVGKLGGREPLAFRRMECEPGAEAQVDFGSGAPVVDGSSRRRPHVLRVVLSHSRKGYSEVIFRQRTEDFLACLENAFWHFGGVPRTIVIDNLKAAVKHADWFDPELHPRILAFCEHYGTAILPTRPYMPRHKGKVERGVAYVQDNAMKGRTFPSLQAQNLHLQQWEANVADTRIHGTMRQQVCKVFEEVERRALLPLPAGRFPFFHESQRTVHRDGHVEVEKAYYSVPPEYLGRPVWVRWDGRMVRIFNQRMVQVALHAQRAAGKFSTQDEHIVSQKFSAVERGTDWLMRRVSRIGEHSERWAAAMLLERGVAGVRVLVGLNSLAGRHDSARIERACQIALTHGAFHLRAIRELIKRGGNEQEQFEFLQEHEIIRDLSSYGHIVRAALRREPAVLPPLEPACAAGAP